MNNEYGYTLMHAKSRSRYHGGFTTINGRPNNTSAYNHDYYEKNKHKWNKKGQTMGGFIGDKANNLFSKWRKQALDSISDFMVDLSMLYLEKMMKDQRLKDLKVDQLVYDTFSPVINKMVNEAVDGAMDRMSKNAAKIATDTVNEVTKNAAKNATNAAADAVNNTNLNDVANNAMDWLNKQKRK